MTPAELAAWREFYIRWPFDDLHRFHRPAALVAACMGSGQDLQQRVTSLIGFLAPEPKTTTVPEQGHFSESDLRTMAAFGVVPPKG